MSLSLFLALAALALLVSLPFWSISLHLGELVDQVRSGADDVRAASYRTTSALNHLALVHDRVASAADVQAQAVKAQSDSTVATQEMAAELFETVAPIALGMLGVDVEPEPEPEPFPGGMVMNFPLTGFSFTIGEDPRG